MIAPAVTKCGKRHRLWLFLLALAIPVSAASAPTGQAPAHCTQALSFFQFQACPFDREQTDEEPRPAALFSPALRDARRNWIAGTTGSGPARSVHVYTDSGSFTAAGAEKKLPARMALRCRDDNTSLYFTFPGQEMGSKGPQREFIYAIDDGQETILELERGKNHSVMGVWQGYRAIPVIRQLLSGKALRISAIASDGNELNAEFAIDGLQAQIEPLRAACHW